MKHEQRRSALRASGKMYLFLTLTVTLIAGCGGDEELASDATGTGGGKQGSSVQRSPSHSGPCDVLGPLELYGDEIPSIEGESVTWPNGDVVTLRHCVPIIGPKNNGIDRDGATVTRHALLDPDFTYEDKPNGINYIRIFYIDSSGDTTKAVYSPDLLYPDPGLSESDVDDLLFSYLDSLGYKYHKGSPNDSLRLYLASVGIDEADTGFRTWTAPEAVIVERDEREDRVRLVLGNCQAAGVVDNVEQEDFIYYRVGNFTKGCFNIDKGSAFEATEETVRARLGINGLRFLQGEADAVDNDLLFYLEYWDEVEHY